MCFYLVVKASRCISVPKLSLDIAAYTLNNKKEENESYFLKDRLAIITNNIRNENNNLNGLVTLCKLIILKIFMYVCQSSCNWNLNNKSGAGNIPKRSLRKALIESS